MSPNVHATPVSRASPAPDASYQGGDSEISESVPGVGSGKPHDRSSCDGGASTAILYNAAYMLDDGIMVMTAVITLSRFKLQERAGRWLKLVSGIVLLLLGLAWLMRPEWLAFDPG